MSAITQTVYSFPMLVVGNFLSASAAAFLRALVRAKQPLAIVGPTGSGKSTLLNACLTECAISESLIVCEDVSELSLLSPFWRKTLTRPAGGMAELIAEGQQTCPDRLVVGEVRDGAIVDTLGVNGTLFTLHAYDAPTALARMQGLVRLNKALARLPQRQVSQMLTDRLHYVVQVGYFKANGRNARRLVSITEVRGLRADQVELAELFRLDLGTGLAAWTGSYPRADRLSAIQAGCPDFNFLRDVVRG